MYLTVFSVKRRKMRHIEGNAKCRHRTTLTCKGTLWQVLICLRPRTPYPPPLYSAYMYTLYLFTHGGGEGESLAREKGRGATGGNRGEYSHKKLGWKYQRDGLYARNWLSPVSDKHLKQSSFTGRFFLMTAFCSDLLWVLPFYVLLSPFAFFSSFFSLCFCIFLCVLLLFSFSYASLFFLLMSFSSFFFFSRLSSSKPPLLFSFLMSLPTKSCVTFPPH